jgi:hypothetical protein
MAAFVCAVTNRIWCLDVPRQRSHVVYPKHMVKAILVHEREIAFVNDKFNSKVLILDRCYEMEWFAVLKHAAK